MRAPAWGVRGGEAGGLREEHDDHRHPPSGGPREHAQQRSLHPGYRGLGDDALKTLALPTVARKPLPVLSRAVATVGTDHVELTTFNFETAVTVTLPATATTTGGMLLDHPSLDHRVHRGKGPRHVPRWPLWQPAGGGRVVGCSCGFGIWVSVVAGNVADTKPLGELTTRCDSDKEMILMGMDVYGKNPASEIRGIFQEQHLVLAAASRLLPDATPRADDRMHLLAQQDADGLDAAGATTLAAATGGRHGGSLRGPARLPASADLHLCAGTGVRTDRIGRQRGYDKARDPNTGIGGCNRCAGQGTTEHPATWYPFDVENVREFTDFLAACGIEIC